MAATAQQVTDQLVALRQKVNDLESQLQTMRAQQAAGGGGGNKKDELQVIDRKRLFPEPYKSGCSWVEWREEVGTMLTTFARL